MRVNGFAVLRDRSPNSRHGKDGKLIVESTPVESESKRTTRYVAGSGSDGVPRSTVRATTREMGADLPTGLPADKQDTAVAPRPEGHPI